MTLNGVLDQVEWELRRATRKFGPFASAHEGYAVILEEIDELWDEVKGDKHDGARGRQRKEALQVAAMGCRYLVDIVAPDEPLLTIDDAIEHLSDALRVQDDPPFASPHEAYGHLRMALLRFDDAVEALSSRPDPLRARMWARSKALGVGALAARFLLDIPEEG